MTTNAATDQQTAGPSQSPAAAPSQLQHTTESSNDIGLFVGDKSVGLDTAQRVRLVREVWTPSSSFSFQAAGKRQLKFQHHWFSRWNWLAFSRVCNGAFCKYCVLFSSFGAGVGHQPLGKLVVTPYTNWKDAVEDFNRHQQSTYHQTCVLKADNLLAVADDKQEAVALQVCTGLKAQIVENRRRIKPIVDTVIFCGRQGISLRGHRDSGPLTPSQEPIENDGNFRALLRFKVRSGDRDLGSHLQSAGGNATYISPKTQNAIIAACNELLVAEVVKRINAAEGFAVLADETTDIAGVEQFSLCARYLDVSTSSIREDFLQFIPVTDVSGEGLATVIVDSLTQLGVNLEYMRGQGYDGASAMSGKFNGVQSHIRKLCPLAVYVHCCSHSLNLAVSDACTVAPIRNCMGTLGNICTFFASSAKRRDALKQSIGKECPDSSATRLRQLCPTRWIERHDAVMVFLDLMEAADDALETISSWPDRETSSKARQLMCAMENSEFLVSVHVLGQVFAVSMPLSRLLQTENMDLCEAMSLAEQLDATLKAMRANAEDEFHQLFGSIQEACQKFGVSMDIPRRAGRQTHRTNIPYTTPEDYFRAAVYIPFVDSFITQVNDRLLQHKSLLQSFRCLMPKEPKTPPTATQVDELRHLYATYASVLDCSEVSVVGEFRLWYQRAAESPNPPRNALEAIAVCNRQIFPSVHKLLHILATLPVTTASSERSFSTLRRLKTYLRNTTGEERLNGLAMLQIHRDIAVDPEAVLQKLSEKSRRLDFHL